MSLAKSVQSVAMLQSGLGRACRVRNPQGDGIGQSQGLGFADPPVSLATGGTGGRSGSERRNRWRRQHGLAYALWLRIAQSAAISRGLGFRGRTLVAVSKFCGHTAHCHSIRKLVARLCSQ